MGPAETRLDAAIALLKGQRGSIELLGPEFTHRARAAAVVGDHYRQHPEQLRSRLPRTPPRRASSPRRATTSAASTSRFICQRDRDADIESGDRNGITGVQKSKGRAGAKLVQRLSGPVTSYFVAALGDGTAGLFETVASDGARDPGRTKLTADQVRRLREADAAKSQRALAGINERNRAFRPNRNA